MNIKLVVGVGGRKMWKTLFSRAGKPFFRPSPLWTPLWKICGTGPASAAGC